MSLWGSHSPMGEQRNPWAHATCRPYPGGRWSLGARILLELASAGPTVEDQPTRGTHGDPDPDPESNKNSRTCSSSNPWIALHAFGNPNWAMKHLQSFSSKWLEEEANAPSWRRLWPEGHRPRIKQTSLVNLKIR